MKANELRTECLVYFEFNNTRKIHAIIPKDIHVMRLAENDGMQSECYQPIPLTEEWLVKFGMAKVTTSWFFNKEMPYYISTSRGFYDLKIAGILLKQIHEVHQLQNLYFAFTGEELILINGE